jgi:hypothetical protein
MRIARQSVWVGIVLSGIAMVVAAFGHIPPVGGALLQEAIDVGVILNALRASAQGRVEPRAEPRARTRTPEAHLPAPERAPTTTQPSLP